jgi:ATP-binding cassette subfamily C protein
VALKSNENKSIEHFQDNLSEVLELFGQIKASNKEFYFFEQSIQKAKNIQTTSNTYNFKSVAYERFSFTIFLAAFEILRATGLLMVVYSDLSIGMMFAMFGYIWFIMTPIQDILSMQYSYASAKAAIKRLNHILQLQKEPQGTQLISKEQNIQISLNQVCFAYTSDKNVLSQIDLDIQAQSKIALIGASGSGKTTLAQLIAGFYHKTSGDIFYNTINSDEVNKSSLRSAIFLVLQMPILFNNTLRFNLTMGDENITDETINHAIKIAQLQDVIQTLPQKLDSLVGKNGIRLSGGQRQRLSIARMIIANPRVVIFDESTSALDVHTETKLFLALESFLKDKTVITIAHRLSTVKNAHKVFVLHEGKIVQQGTHKQLEQQEGHYSQFVKNQLM